MTSVEARVLEILGELQEIMDEREFGEALSRTLGETLRADGVVLHALGPDRAGTAAEPRAITFVLPGPHGSVVRVALRRDDADFSAAERDVVEAARPFLAQLYRNARAFTALSADSARHAPAAVTGRLTGAGLTPRESEVVHRAALGHTNEAIADDLSLSVRTVHKHLEHAFRKLGVRTRAEAAARVWATVSA